MYVFLEREEGREKETERNIDVRKSDWLALLSTLTKPATQHTLSPGIQPKSLCPARHRPTEPHWSGQKW